MVGKTCFDRKLDTAIELSRAIHGMEHNAKLSGPAFFADACKAGLCKAADVDRLETVLAATPGTDSASGFIAVLARALAEPNFRRAVPTAKLNKALAAYGSSETIAQVASVGGTLGQACALAARQAVARWPSRFGKVTDMDRHATEVANAKARLADMAARLAAMYTPRDLYVDSENLTADQRAAGLARICFRRCPAIGPANANWPEALITALASAVAAPVLVAPHTEDALGEGESAVMGAGGIRRANRSAVAIH